MERRRSVDAGVQARSTTLRREELSSRPAPRGPWKGPKQKGLKNKAEPRPAPGEQAPRGIPRERISPALSGSRGGRGGAARRYSPLGPPPLVKTGVLCPGASPVGAANSPTPRVRSPAGARERPCLALRPLVTYSCFYWCNFLLLPDLLCEVHVLFIPDARCLKTGALFIIHMCIMIHLVHYIHQNAVFL